MRKIALGVVAAGAFVSVNTANAAESNIGQSIPVTFIVQRMFANAQSAPEEHTEVARIVKTVTGISLRDIDRYGIFGGPNSVFRKPFG